MFAEHFYVDHRPVDVTKFNRAKQTFDAVNDLEPAAVAQGQDKSETGVASSLLDGFVQLLLRTRGQISQPPNRLKTHIFSINSGVFSLKNFSSKRISAMTSVLGRCQFSAEKRVKGEILHL